MLKFKKIFIIVILILMPALLFNISAKTDFFGNVYKWLAYMPHNYNSDTNVNNVNKDYCNPKEVHENPPALHKEPVSIPITVKSITSDGYICYNKKKRAFILSKSYLKQDVAQFLLKNNIEFYAVITPVKNSNSYTIANNYSGHRDINIFENGVFVEEITPDLFVFKTDKDVKLLVSGVKKFDISKEHIINKYHLRISCVPTDKVIKGLPVFRYVTGKDLAGD